MAESEIDADASLRDVMKVQVQLGSERCTLSVGVLDKAYCAEGKGQWPWMGQC